MTVVLAAILANTLVALGFNILLRARSRALEEDFLARQGETAARMAEEYLLRTGSWKEVGTLLDRAFSGRRYSNRWPDRPPREHYGRSLPPMRFYLFDDRERMVYRSLSLPESVPLTQNRIRIALLVKDTRVGWLVPVPPDRVVPGRPFSVFLSGLNKALFLMTLCSSLLIVVAGSLIIRRLLKPLDALAGGVRKLASGDYAIRLNPSGRGEVLQLQKEFNRMAGAVELVDARNRQLIGDTAHDLRTPLSLITGQIEMIREGIYTADPPRLEKIHKELLQIAALVEEMEELARLESGTFPLKREQFPAEAPVLEVINRFREMAAVRKIRIETIFPPKGGTLLIADYVKVVRVFQNLLDNALRHTPDQGCVTVTMDPGTDGIVFTVTDSGPGIPQGEEELIFRRFYRSDKSRNRNTGGSGLGLAISRAVVEAHGGTIRAGNRTDGGACFTLWFPTRSR